MRITSSAFEHGGHIPEKYTCDGEGVNPPLEFHDLPDDTASLVLIVEDPDVPTNLRPDGMWDHWIIYNIPRSVTTIEENSQPEGEYGMTTSGSTEYVPACPPDREHRYYFKLYALNQGLMLPPNAVKLQVTEAMKGHILAEAELIGKYVRQ